VATVAAGVVGYHVALTNFSAEARRIKRFAEVIDAHSAPEEPILFIATSVDPGYPVLMSLNRRPGSRYLHAFPIPMLYRSVTNHGQDFPYRRPFEQPPAERQFLAELGTDALRNRPALIFVCMRNPCDFCPAGFRVDEYLQRTGWQAQYMKAYRLLGTVPGFAVYGRNQGNRMSVAGNT